MRPEDEHVKSVPMVPRGVELGETRFRPSGEQCGRRLGPEPEKGKTREAVDTGMWDPHASIISVNSAVQTRVDF